jgi:1-acyl-sn-glycerol-3-phosphate acyltransferase
MLGAVTYFVIWLLLQTLRVLRIWRWKIEGLENLPPRGKGMVLAINHLHWLDILIVGGSLPFSHRLHWIAKVEIFANRFLAWWFTEMQVIPIKRGQRDIAALVAAEECLKEGAVLAVFPEGHRSREGGLQEGRGGTVRLAIRSGTPIVPIGISGTSGGLKGAFLRKPITLRIGKPYTVDIAPQDKIPVEQMSALTEDMMLRIAELLPEEQRGFYRERLAQRKSQSESVVNE